MTQSSNIDKQLGSGTQVYVDNSDMHGYTCVSYQGVEVVCFNEVYIILNRGGLRHQGVKFIMNKVSGVFNLGFRVFQHKDGWFIEFNGKVKKFIYETESLFRLVK